MKYDANVIVQFAERLYSKANSVIIRHAILGLLIGAAIGYSAGKSTTIAAVAAVGIGIVGYLMGVEKAFQYKLQAQTALCQVQIEVNTRA